jgi:hypothetical protein
MFLKLGKGSLFPRDDSSMIAIVGMSVIMDPAESKIAEMSEYD